MLFSSHTWWWSCRLLVRKVRELVILMSTFGPFILMRLKASGFALVSCHWGEKQFVYFHSFLPVRVPFSRVNTFVWFCSGCLYEGWCASEDCQLSSWRLISAPSQRMERLSAETGFQLIDRSSFQWLHWNGYQSSLLEGHLSLARMRCDGRMEAIIMVDWCVTKRCWLSCL